MVTGQRQQRIYLDNNLYSTISREASVQEVRKALRQRRSKVFASSSNLLELLVSSNQEGRIQDIDTLKSLASEFEDKPSSWHQAQEVNQAIKLHRSEWCKLPSVAEINEIRNFLRGHQE